MDLIHTLNLCAGLARTKLRGLLEWVHALASGGWLGTFGLFEASAFVGSPVKFIFNTITPSNDNYYKTVTIKLSAGTHSNAKNRILVITI